MSRPAPKSFVAVVPFHFAAGFAGVGEIVSNASAEDVARGLARGAITQVPTAPLPAKSETEE